MKRAKLALTAVAVLAVVGGALAFKATTQRNFYSTGANGNCTALVQTKYDVLTTTTIPGAFVTTLSTASDASNPCPVITVKIGA